MNRHKFKFFFLLALLFPPSIVQANSLQKTYNVISFTSQKYSELQEVKAITQDQHGFMWFASNNGLFRFDGKNLKKYSLNIITDKSFIKVKSLLIDKQNHLWVGTENGLLLYQEKNDSFQKIELKPDLLNPNILNILEDKNKNIWVGTRDNGLFKISTDEKSTVRKIVHFYNGAKEGLDISNNSIRSLYQTRNGDLWIGTKKGLNHYSTITKRISHYFVNPTHTKQTQLAIYSMLELNNKLLLGTNQGLFKFNKRMGTRSLYSKNKELLSSIYAIKYSHDGKLLVGTKIDGLLIITPESQEIMRFNKNSEINSNMIYDLYSDKAGNVWFGTNTGLHKLIYDSNIIELYRQQNNNKKCIASNENHAIFVDSKSNLWIGARGKGLTFINQADNKCELYNSKNINLPDTTLTFITDIKEDTKGNIWIATYGEGVIKYDPIKNMFSQLEFDDSKNNQIAKKGRISEIAVDRDNNIWLGLFDHGLVKYNQDKRTLNTFGTSIAKKYQRETLTVRTLKYVNNTLWLGTNYLGLIAFDIKTNNIKSYSMDEKNIDIITSAVDSNQTLWLGTNGYGLFKFNTKNKQHAHYQAENGLANNSIFDIQVDANNSVWIGTYNGLSLLNNTTSSFTNYYKKDGLQSNDSSLGGFFDKRTGFLWLGGMHGINRIDTNAVNKKNEQSSLYLTNLKINGEEIKVNTKKQPSPLKENIISAKTLTLTHLKNNFAFNFANINYQNTDKLNYQYQLEGYDHWTDIDSENLIANYTNIPPGQYLFKVRVTNNKGQWTTDEKSIEVTILPPWWLTTFALAIYVLLLLLTIYAVVHYRTRTLKNKADELERSIYKRTEELAEEKHKVELLLKQKNEEFANLSHEFRTPLTLILGTSSQLLTSNLNEKELNRIEVIKRNGYRLLRMVDQLLNIETFRVKAVSQKSLQHTGNIISQLIEAFSDLALEKGIQLQIINIEEINFELMQDALDKIVVNLLSNAIKYTANGGSITIETKRTANNELFIQIVDTGIGIPEDQLKNVFEKYNRVINKGSEQITGAGIGLALIKELIISHNGSVSLTSELESGTCVTVLLPIINEASTLHRHELLSLHTQTDNIVAMELMNLTQQPVSSSSFIETISSQEKSEKLKILVIEDNHDMSHFITSFLHDEYIVLNAYDGLEGVKLSEQEVPDLIISDVMMPKLDGYQTTQKIRQNPITNHIPIILLTSRQDLESKLKGWHHQIDEYLTKPFNEEELKVRIKNLLAIRNILKNRHNNMILKGSHINPNILEEISDTSTIELMKKQERFIENLNQTLEEKYTDTSITVNTIARAMAMSERQLFRKLKSVLGITPTEYLRRFRLEKACLLLAKGQSAINTAFDTGFSSQSYFGKCFKNEYGYPPSEFKKHLLDIPRESAAVTLN